MEKKNDSSKSRNEIQDNTQLMQTIIGEMKAQGFLDDFVDEETGKAILEMQFADETFVCNVENVNEEDLKKEGEKH